MPESDTLANEGFINNRWRPFMAWQYFVVCLCDFIVFPAFTTVWYSTTQYHEWHPLTLQGGGLYHLSMGAIIGVTSWQRSQEKMAIMSADRGSFVESSRTTETVTSKDSSKPGPVVTPTIDPTQPTKPAVSSRAD